MAQRPLVSVIIPAFRAHSTIARAVASIQSSGLPSDRVEIIVASDDGRDYRDVLSNYANVVTTPTGPIRTGPGETRNRALVVARGSVIAFLDADDTWEAQFLSRLLPLAHSHGAAFGIASARRKGREIARFGGGDTLTLETVGRSGASFHPVVQRDLVGRFATRWSQDTFHTVEVLALLGGSAPMGDVQYQITLHDQSTTQTPGFAEALDTDYRFYRDTIRRGESRVPEAAVAQAARVFTDRIALNADYQANANGVGFYDYLARHQKTRTKQLAA